MMRAVVLVIMWLPSSLHDVFAQEENPVYSNVVVSNSFWDNWYVQVGADMWLQNPYGANFMNVFPNGKTFGVDGAIGKWFTPEYGMRAKVNWENGIIKNNHASWVNSEKGYVVIAGDFLLNLNNFLGSYNPNRKWNVYIFPRAGVLMNLRTNIVVGSPLIGVGFGGSYRFNGRWSVYGDMAYQMSSSALGQKTKNGSGSSSNGYFDFNIGVQLNLGKSRFYSDSKEKEWSKHSVCLNPLWDNWFVQAGLGMSLMNPYGANFANVFPYGNTYGINIGLGKWVIPEVALRAGFNWQNGIVGNNHLKWLDEEGNPGSNHKGGGYAAAYIDAFFHMNSIFSGYDHNRVWNMIVFPRAGLDYNLELSSGSPILGAGIENTFRISDNLSLFADVVYQVTSGGFLEGRQESSHHNGASSGWFDINIGVQYDFGKNWWDKPGANSSNGSRLKVQNSHNWPRFAVNTVASVAVGYIGKTALKAVVNEERPDHSDNKSFPSGHATIAFAAARSIDKEFRKDCIWIPIAGYAAATAIGIERVASDRHHLYDVVAGAALGFGAAELTWWASDKLLGKQSAFAIGTSGNTVDVVYNF